MKISLVIPFYNGEKFCEKILTIKNIMHII